jgi:hypothetical protein
MANTKHLIQKIAADPSLLYSITPREFEEVIAELLASFGWQVNVTSATRDGGYDILAVSKDRSGFESTWVVECKRYRRDRKVGIEVARSIYGVKSIMAASNALLIAANDFTKDAIAFVTPRYDMQLAGYERVIEWIRQYEPSNEGESYLPRQLFYSCFISYSSEDQDFASRLYADLKNRGVRCWFAPEDMKIGDKIRDRIDESIRLRDKLLLILSESSIASDWVEHEVENVLEEERQSKRIALFPIRLDDAVMNSSEAWAALIRRTRHIGDFTGWKEEESYQKALERLLRDLKSEQQDGVEQITQDDLLRHAIMSPRNTIKEEWDKAEEAVIQAAKRNGLIKRTGLVSCSQLINELHEAGKISGAVREKFFTLSKAHLHVTFDTFSSVEPGTAVGFANEARELVNALSFDTSPLH